MFGPSGKNLLGYKVLQLEVNNLLFTQNRQQLSAPQQAEQQQQSLTKSVAALSLDGVAARKINMVSQGA